jgi:hypothetical protein
MRRDGAARLRLKGTAAERSRARDKLVGALLTYQLELVVIGEEELGEWYFFSFETPLTLLQSRIRLIVCPRWL